MNKEQTNEGLISSVNIKTVFQASETDEILLE